MIELFHLLQSLAEPQTARRGPGRLAAYDNQLNILPGGWIGPPNFESTLRIIGEQYRSGDFATVTVLDIGESNVF